MQDLSFPAYQFRVKNSENKTAIFDIIRKKFVILTPEEWVRQHVLHFLVKEKKYPKSLINVEKQLIINGTKKRYDIVTFKTDGSIFLIVECKAPKISIKQETFDQIARYNLELKSDFLMVTNGLHHYYCSINYKTESYHFLKELPIYSSSSKH